MYFQVKNTLKNNHNHTLKNLVYNNLPLSDSLLILDSTCIISKMTSTYYQKIK
jgi:hypothetical protein